MINDDDEIKNFFKNEIISTENAPIKIYHSTSHAPGESEQKFFDIIRNEDSLKSNHYIYSNDSDSIIGSLQFIDKNIFIIIKNDERKPYLKSPYSIIDIKKFREYLLSKLHFHGQFDVKRVMHDVIALSPLWCNDIIPIFRDISKKEHYFDTLLDSYFKINKNKANNYEYLIDDNNKICFSTFIKVISQFFKREIKIATPKEKQKNKRKCEMAKEVYRTLNFCFLYITQGVPSWTYYYPYDKSDNYVNDISDLIRYMDQEENNFVEFTISTKVDFKSKKLSDQKFKNYGGHIFCNKNEKVK